MPLTGCGEIGAQEVHVNAGLGVGDEHLGLAKVYQDLLSLLNNILQPIHGIDMESARGYVTIVSEKLSPRRG